MTGKTSRHGITHIDMFWKYLYRTKPVELFMSLVW